MPTSPPSGSASSGLPGQAAAPRPFHLWAGVLSYLVPGLGQIVQGRYVKGALFCVCIYGLFFYGMALGSGTVRFEDREYRVSSNVYLPDTVAEESPPSQMPTLANNLYNRPQFLGQFWAGVVSWPAIIQYLSYDKEGKGHPILGNFEREPDSEALNVLHTSGDKRMELGWVYTVIAGVLNILVIYDACSGPAFGARDRQPGAARPGEPSGPARQGDTSR
jgi:hypothetical protein